MRKKKLIIFLAFLGFLMVSCEKDEPIDSSQYFMKAIVDGNEEVFSEFNVEKNFLTEDIEISGSNDKCQIKLVVNDMNVGTYSEADYYSFDESDAESSDISEDYDIYFRKDNNGDGKFDYKDNRWGYWGASDNNFRIVIEKFESKSEIKGTFEAVINGSYSNVSGAAVIVTINNGSFCIQSKI